MIPKTASTTSPTGINHMKIIPIQPRGEGEEEYPQLFIIPLGPIYDSPSHLSSCLSKQEPKDDDADNSNNQPVNFLHFVFPFICKCVRSADSFFQLFRFINYYYIQINQY